MFSAGWQSLLGRAFTTASTCASAHPTVADKDKRLRIALLHLAPVPAAVADNRNLVEEAIVAAARAGADWIVTPELVTTGYSFADQIGTDWILPQPDPWMMSICGLAARLQVTLFLSSPERDREGPTLYNTVFVIARTGEILGRHRKINTLPTGSEAWSTPGREAGTIVIPPIGNVGILICADAYTPGIVNALKANGARLLVSSASWAPGFHGPEGVWERATADTGLPLIVCNRTGEDAVLSFVGAESVVAHGGERLLSLSSDRATIFIIDWDIQKNTLAGPHARKIDARLPAAP
jgi:predicted amidohydrolase